MPEAYVPPAHPGWERRDPAAAGFDPRRLAEAVAFAETHETGWARELAEVIGKGHFEPPPLNEIIGPVRDRGGPNGLVVRHGRIVTSWGDVERADMTFSATKSYISICAGLAFDDGLLPDPDEPVGVRIKDGGFDAPQNRAVTWHHLLQQTSEWEGALWGKPDSIDRYRDLDTEGDNARKGELRPLHAPGGYWEYNDVRVNRLSLAVLRLVQRGLPDLLAERIMRPIGASADWEWHGYRNSGVEIAGKTVTSVSGGGHWGGGLFISSLDHARVGLLMARNGLWGDRQLLSREWIRRSLAPCPLKPDYGYLWWLNTGRSRFPDAPEGGFQAAGAGSNIVWIDPDADLVAVVRWIDRGSVGGFLSRLYAALKS